MNSNGRYNNNGRLSSGYNGSYNGNYNNRSKSSGYGSYNSMVVQNEPPHAVVKVHEPVRPLNEVSNGPRQPLRPDCRSDSRNDYNGRNESGRYNDRYNDIYNGNYSDSHRTFTECRNTPDSLQYVSDSNRDSIHDHDDYRDNKDEIFGRVNQDVRLQSNVQSGVQPVPQPVPQSNVVANIVDENVIVAGYDTQSTNRCTNGCTNGFTNQVDIRCNNQYIDAYYDIDKSESEENDDDDCFNVSLKIPKKVKKVIIPSNTNVSRYEYYGIEGNLCNNNKYINIAKGKLCEKCNVDTLNLYRSFTVSKGKNHEIDDKFDDDPRLGSTRIIDDFRINSVVKIYKSLKNTKKSCYDVTDCILGLISLKRLDVLCQTLVKDGEYVLCLQDYRNFMKQHYFKVISVDIKEIGGNIVNKIVHTIKCCEDKVITITVAAKRSEGTVLNDSYYNELIIDTKDSYQRVSCDMYNVFSKKNMTEYSYLREIFLFKK